MICAQCHSLRDVVAPGFAAGAEYYDHFMPMLEYEQRPRPDPAYWADGRPRRFSNDALGLWQSDCFLKGGVTCTTLPHRSARAGRRPQPPAGGQQQRALHAVPPGDRRATRPRTRARAGSAGSSCVECHMPKTVFSIKATMRDHTISLPTPENTVASASRTPATPAIRTGMRRGR